MYRASQTWIIPRRIARNICSSSIPSNFRYSQIATELFEYLSCKGQAQVCHSFFLGFLVELGYSGCAECPELARVARQPLNKLNSRCVGEKKKKIGFQICCLRLLDFPLDGRVAKQQLTQQASLACAFWINNSLTRTHWRTEPWIKGPTVEQGRNLRSPSPEEEGAASPVLSLPSLVRIGVTGQLWVSSKHQPKLLFPHSVFPFFFPPAPEDCPHFPLHKEAVVSTSAKLQCLWSSLLH